jgi:Outer membrane protein beta-barrel domain
MPSGLFWNRILAMVGVGAGALVMSGTASAQAEDEFPEYKVFEITPFLGGMGGGSFEDPVDGSSRDLDAAPVFGVIFDAATEYWRHYEVLYARQSTSLTGVTEPDLDVQYLQFGGIVSYPEALRIIPFFGMTLGAAFLSPDEPGLKDETELAFSVGTGVRVPITEHIGVRLDARAFITLLDTEGDVFCASTEGTGTCRIKAKSDTLVQYSAALGVIVAF